MTSSITQFSSLIDVTFPIPGADNDTQGFRNNYIQIVQSLNTAASEITNLQIQQSALVTMVNNSTVIGTNYLASLLSTVTTMVSNSLTNVVVYTTSTPVSSEGQLGDVPGILAADANYIYVSYGYYSTGTDIWSRIATTASTWTTVATPGV